MNKVIFLLILINSWLGSIKIGINCEKQISQIQMADFVKNFSPPRPLYELRRLDLLDLRIAKEWLKDWKSYKMRQTLLKEMLQVEIKRKKQEILKKEAVRQKIYEQHLLGFQGRSKVLNDFHTNRF